MNLSPRSKKASEYVATANDEAMVKLFKGGSLEEALSSLDVVRDRALEMVGDDEEARNEIECRRFEWRIHAAFFAKDYDLIWQVLREAGDSNRFTSERLHYFLGVIGGLVRGLGKETK